MPSSTDLKGKRCLFVSYFYPPAAGTGLPGTMRSVKFIRNLLNAHIHVLTIKKEHYNKSVKLDTQVSLPVNGEAIYRSEVFDFFGCLLNLRSRFLGLWRRKVQAPENPSLVFATSGGVDCKASEVGKKGVRQRFKDFIYNLCNFPDQASPWIFRAFQLGRRIIVRQKIDVIFATGMPWSALVVGWLLSRWTGKALIVDFRDPWVNNPFHLSKGRLFDSLNRWLEKRIVTHAAVVSVNTETLREDFVIRYPQLDFQKLVVLPNGYDPKDFSWLASEGFNSSQPNELVLCHAGFLYGLRDPAPLLDAIEICRQRLAGETARVRFLQVGRVELGYALGEKYAAMVEDGTLELCDEIPYRECLKVLAGADVLVNVQPETRTQVPSKLYDYLALERPIINLTPRDGALGRMVVQYGFGDLFERGDTEHIADRLLELLRQKQQGELRADYPERSRFDITVITQKLALHLRNASNPVT